MPYKPIKPTAGVAQESSPYSISATISPVGRAGSAMKSEYSKREHLDSQPTAISANPLTQSQRNSRAAPKVSALETFANSKMTKSDVELK